VNVVLSDFNATAGSESFGNWQFHQILLGWSEQGVWHSKQSRSELPLHHPTTRRLMEVVADAEINNVCKLPERSWRLPHSTKPHEVLHLWGEMSAAVKLVGDRTWDRPRTGKQRKGINVTEEGLHVTGAWGDTPQRIHPAYNFWTSSPLNAAFPSNSSLRKQTATWR
jgi:hypothetical protein